MLLNDELVSDAINSRRPIGKLLSSDMTVFDVFNDYVVFCYFSDDYIPMTKINGIPTKTPASVLFNNYQKFFSIDIDTLIKKLSYEQERDPVTAEIVKLYQENKTFPFEYAIHFFETFVVAEIMPNSLKTELILITPDRGWRATPLTNTPNARGGDESVGAVEAQLAVMAVSTAAIESKKLQLGLYFFLGQLLEYLRTGLGKKKRFGIF